MRVHENFDEGFPYWFEVDTESTVPASAEKRLRLIDWGRRDTNTGHEWMEMWGLDEVLSLFGFPEDLDKPIPTTYVRGYTDD